MSPANHRHERVGEEIAHEINAMLAGELKDPRLEVSVVASEVRVQPLRFAIGIISIRREAKAESRLISFSAPGIKLHQPRGPAKQQHKNAGGQRIERTQMSDLPEAR